MAPYRRAAVGSQAYPLLLAHLVAAGRGGDTSIVLSRDSSSVPRFIVPALALGVGENFLPLCSQSSGGVVYVSQ